LTLARLKSTVRKPVQQAPAISRSSFGRTLGVAGWVLGAAALAEILAGGMALTNRARHIEAGGPGAIAEAVPPPGAAHPQPSFGDPFASITNSTPASKPAPLAIAAATPTASPILAAALPKPTPVDETQVAGPETRLDGLVAEARALRAKGDMSTAITRLREAAAMSPKNALVISELAETYDKMGLQDKGLEQWRLIHDLGDSAGVYYELADAKLKAAELAAQATPAGSPASDNGGAPVPDANGFQPGSSLALVNLSTVEKPETSEGYKRFTLKIPVKRRPDVKINVASVVIQVFFYDELGDNSIVRTNANVSSHWSTLPADWSQDDIEILEVDYTQAPPEPGKIEEGRHYYGYVVCIYYNKDLQDQAADPDTLIKKFPPPLTLPDK
jgi:tetratricopeptide (TPR) repeat protein